MKAKLGIVGPKDSVNFIYRIAEEYDNIYPVQLMYHDPEEITNIVQKNERVIDIWVFSGLTPYTLAKKNGLHKLSFYLELDGSSLTKTLMEIGYKDRKNIQRISLDMLEEHDVYETYDDLGIPYEKLYLYEYQGYTPFEEIVAFHQNLFKDNKVDVCVTCLRYVYEQLESLSVPVYRVTPTRVNIRETLKAAYQQWETQQFKQSQIAVMLIRTGDAKKIDSNKSFSYDLHRLDLELQNAIVDYAESISGSYVSLGIGNSIVFSTRGSLEGSGQQGLTLLEKLSLISDLPSNIGIGYGETSLAAEESARLALYHAQKYGEFSAFLVDNNGTIEGPLKEQQSIAYGYRNENKEISDRLKQAGVTITTFNKILSVQTGVGNHAITASDVAEWLKMTPRHARRILNSLAEQELAEIIGEDAPTSRGRPRRIYRVGTDL
ncbi:hypothetical protein EV207_11055 [Scopulibacillus darangshiensis]|uniref:Transcriptional regulator n=1 Tax=Scopulibacillus darangshiensis TaxID=442528 RepID=A0A4R2P5N6_9BACL|nr:hypothetical protein [Scopulibacillus darangshiensis]TCP29434.1 hypothetical protein EV207_11055 [Scopulibacillus darangshiensis]